MRTKNAKRLWPVPVTLAVVALAAFLAFGLLANAGVQTASAQGFDANATASTEKNCEADVTRTTDLLGGGCTITADSLDVVFSHDDAEAANVRVYVTGGSGFPGVQASSDTEPDNSQTAEEIADPIGKKGVDRHDLRFAADAFAEKREQTITVTSGMADSKGQVYLFAYDAPDAGNADLVATSTSLQAAAKFGILVQFVGEPAFGKDGDDEDDVVTATNDPATNEERSKVVVTAETPNNAETNNDGDGSAEITLADADDEATITVTVQDAGGQNLKGSVAFMISSVGAGITSTRHKDLNDMGTVPLTVDQLPTDTAFRVEVEIVFSNDQYTFNMGKAIIKRTGDPTIIVGATFSVDCLVDDGVADNEDANNPYSDDTFTMKGNDDCVMDDRFGAGEVIVVKAHLEDALGSIVSNATTLSVDLDGEVDKPLDTANPLAALADPPTDAIVLVYTVDDKAMLGGHEITVSTTVEDVDDLVLMASVAGPPASYMLVNPDDSIALGGYGMFTVQAHDAVGGAPDFGEASADDNMVEVFIQGLPDGNTRGVVDGMVMLDKVTGMGSFTIFAPNSAEDGDTIRIFVASGTMEQQHDVTFGAASTTPGPTDELGMVTDVVTGFNRGGSLQVSWTKAANASGYIIIGINVNDVNGDVVSVPLNDGDLETWNIGGLTRGATYDIYVAATASGGRNTLSEAVRVTAQ